MVGIGLQTNKDINVIPEGTSFAEFSKKRGREKQKIKEKGF